MLKVAILNAEFGFEERILTVIAREVLVSPDGGGMLIVMISNLLSSWIFDW